MAIETHSHYLPAQNLVTGPLAADPEIAGLLHRLWQIHRLRPPGAHDRISVSVCGAVVKVRVCRQAASEGTHPTQEVLDLPVDEPGAVDSPQARLARRVRELAEHPVTSMP